MLSRNSNSTMARKRRSVVIGREITKYSEENNYRPFIEGIKGTPSLWIKLRA